MINNSSTAGSITQLAGNENSSYMSNYFINNNETQFSTDISSIKFENNIARVNSNQDSFIPSCIISDKEIEYVNLLYGGNIINTFPMFFCNELCDEKKEINDKIIYNIPWNILFEKNLISVGMYGYTFEIKTKDNTICEAILYQKNFYYPAQMRASLVQNTQFNKMKNINGKNTKLEEGVNVIEMNQRNGLVKGFFFLFDNFEEIKQISFYICGHTRFSYNKFQIELFSKKISNNLVYIGLDLDNGYDNDNYNGALNLNGISDVKFEIESLSKQNSSIFFFTPNVLKTLSGCCGLLFTYSSGFEIEKEIIIKIINKIIEGDNLCPIEHMEIEKGEKYMSCNTCKKNFMEENIKIWLNMKITKICPHCRSNWSNFQVYINDDSEEHIDEQVVVEQAISV